MNMEAIINMPYSEDLIKVLAPTADMVLNLLEEWRETLLKSGHCTNYFRMLAIVMKAKESRNWFQPQNKGNINYFKSHSA